MDKVTGFVTGVNGNLVAASLFRLRAKKRSGLCPGG